jgi:hypothetical protein
VHQFPNLQYLADTGGRRNHSVDSVRCDLARSLLPKFENFAIARYMYRKRVPIFETILRHGVEAKRPTLRPKRLHLSTQWAHGTIISDAFEHRALGSGRFHDRYFGRPAFIYLYTVIEIQPYLRVLTYTSCNVRIHMAFEPLQRRSAGFHRPDIVESLKCTAGLM